MLRSGGRWLGEASVRAGRVNNAYEGKSDDTYGLYILPEDSMDSNDDFIMHGLGGSGPSADNESNGSARELVRAEFVQS